MNPLDLMLLALMAVAFWLLILRPAKVRRQAQARLVASLAPGKRVMSAGGIFGTIVAVTPDRVHLEVAPGMVLELLPQAIAEVLPEVAAEPGAVASGTPDTAGLTAGPDEPEVGAGSPAPPPAPASDAPVDPAPPVRAPIPGEADRG